MPTTRNIKAGYTSNTSSSGSSTLSLSIPPASPSQSDLFMIAPPDSLTLAESPNDTESLPPRMRLKEKRKPLGKKFRIIRESAPIEENTTELKPIPSPPWANDCFSLDSPHRLHDNTRGKGTSHAHTSFPFNATTGPPFRRQERCTHRRDTSRSSAECSTTGGLQALSISSSSTWTASNRPHHTDDTSSDAGPSLGTRLAYQLRPHQTVKPRVQTASMLAEEEQSVPDEDEDDIAMASAVLKQLQHSGTEANTFTPPARPSRKQKRYACDVCGQIFTRSGDVRRHKESRHDNSEGCRCPFCDRVLTRQDALQRHWDKYCRKKSKRHLDKQADETQTRNISPMSNPLYGAPGMSPTQTTSVTTTMGIGTVLDQSQINYRYLNIFG